MTAFLCVDYFKCDLAQYLHVVIVGSHLVSKKYKIRLIFKTIFIYRRLSSSCVRLFFWEVKRFFPLLNLYQSKANTLIAPID